MKPSPEAVHDALRRWHTGGYNVPPWGEMLIVAQCLAEQIVPNLDLAVKKVLLEALDTLAEQAGGNAAQAQLLRLRFLDSLTAYDVANRLNLTENVVYKHQRLAIQNLAALVWQAERAAISERAARVTARLEVQRPPCLFGVADKLADLMATLTAGESLWLVAVVGIGGIGKTALADAVVRRVIGSPYFADVAWVSARQDRFTLWDGLSENPEGKPALTFEGLLDAIVEQFDFQDLAPLPPAHKQAGLSARLKAQPYLIVVDNLETATDYRALVPHLQALTGPAKFLLTCRHSLHQYPGVYNLTLDELSARDSLALLRHEADERRMADVTAASDETLLQIYRVTGGNPLALKLLVGQMYTLSLSQVVDDLRQARGRSVEELYRYIYWRAWHLLTDDARQVLAIMPLVAESGGGLAQIEALGELDDQQLTAALKQLVLLSLVNVRGALEDRRYSIHRLTETFLLQEVIKWQAQF